MILGELLHVRGNIVAVPGDVVVVPGHNQAVDVGLCQGLLGLRFTIEVAGLQVQ